MTKLEKVQMAKGNPFLIAPEVEISPIVTIVGEPKIVKTKFKDEQWVVDVEIKKGLSEPEYSKLKLQDHEERSKHNTRSWFINGTSFNYLIDTLGEDSEKWNGKTVEVEALMQVVQGERKEIIYAKGSV